VAYWKPIAGSAQFSDNADDIIVYTKAIGVKDPIAKAAIEVTVDAAVGTKRDQKAVRSRRRTPNKEALVHERTTRSFSYRHAKAAFMIAFVLSSVTAASAAGWAMAADTTSCYVDAGYCTTQVKNDPADLQLAGALLTAFTAGCVAREVARRSAQIEMIPTCGGGRLAADWRLAAHAIASWRFCTNATGAPRRLGGCLAELLFLSIVPYSL
jgi:hypothetical protein